MSDDDDFPHLADERRAYRRSVALSIIAVLGGLTVVVLKISLVIEVFAFDRGGRDFVATIQYPPGTEDSALRLVAPVLASVK
jgi:hypothetical protein